MINFLTETLDVLKEHGKSSSDVLYIANHEREEVLMDWNDFCSIANFEYKNGYGLEYISMDLMIIGTDWWLERDSYDGSEWWEYKQLSDVTFYRKAPLAKRFLTRK